MSEKTTAKTKKYAFADITGQKFGRITALHPTQRRSKRGHLIWHCRCDCGRELDISYNDLVYTNRKSCGCRKQEHNQELKNILTTSVLVSQYWRRPTRRHSGKAAAWVTLSIH